MRQLEKSKKCEVSPEIMIFDTRQVVQSYLGFVHKTTNLFAFSIGTHIAKLTSKLSTVHAKERLYFIIDVRDHIRYSLLALFLFRLIDKTTYNYR